MIKLNFGMESESRNKIIAQLENLFPTAIIFHCWIFCSIKQKGLRLTYSRLCVFHQTLQVIFKMNANYNDDSCLDARDKIKLLITFLFV